MNCRKRTIKFCFIAVAIATLLASVLIAHRTPVVARSQNTVPTPTPRDPDMKKKEQNSSQSGPIVVKAAGFGVSQPVRDLPVSPPNPAPPREINPLNSPAVPVANPRKKKRPRPKSTKPKSRPVST